MGVHQTMESSVEVQGEGELGQFHSEDACYG